MRMIDADALITKMDEMISNAILADTEIHYALIRELVAEQPTIEAKPVRHGRWILIGRSRITKSRDLKCSVCGNYFRVYDDVTLNAGRGDANFCPNCGAMMDGGAEQ